ncbi:hypothetical protein K4F52_006907 [Lecanicillium sp. MT-2017a]|nr:hypothetical protein K4F52_006907 [Lecanicillium sp. MT-2017a]
MSSTEQQFLALLRSDNIKDALFPHLSTSDLCAIRQSSSACCNLLTKRLFTRIHVTFTANTFTKPSRVSALSRVGHHIEHLTFHFAHSDATFLPPLIHPQTGEEISFLYTPHTSMDSALTRPKYANTELGDILTLQYPPLFHAATNVPSFINAFHHLPNMRHLTIRCPGQDPAERYRRDIVDYALISLRIAVERAPVNNLHKLSLSSLHPAALNYLRHVAGFGSVPSAGRRWKQIRKLHMSIESWDFHGPSPGLDHLKIIEDYIRTLSPKLEKLSFSWIGRKGPCPISLSADALFAPPRSSKKLFHEVTSPMSPLPVLPGRSPIHFPALRYLQIRNATMNAPQLRQLITSHQKTVKEFDFENVSLADKGKWAEALAPVDEDRTWSRSSFTTPSECSLVTSESSDDLPSPSAAVEAASRDLLGMDFGGFGFDEEEKSVIEGLSEEIAAAREASSGFTTKLKKKRTKHHKSKHRKQHKDRSDDDDRASHHSHHSSSSSKSHKRKPSEPRLKPSFESTRAPVSIPDPLISPPIMASDPQPVLLQPTVYDPSGRKSHDDGITAVQRNLEQEEAHRLLAEDAAARVSALQRAKDAVMNKLTREFSKKAKTNGAVAACRLLASRDIGGYCGRDFVLEDRRTIESQSAVVPLMFNRY